MSKGFQPTIRALEVPVEFLGVLTIVQLNPLTDAPEANKLVSMFGCSHQLNDLILCYQFDCTKKVRYKCKRMLYNYP